MYTKSPCVMGLFKNPFIRYHRRTVWWQRVNEYVELSVRLPLSSVLEPIPFERHASRYRLFWGVRRLLEGEQNSDNFKQREEKLLSYKSGGSSGADVPEVTPLGYRLYGGKTTTEHRSNGIRSQIKTAVENICLNNTWIKVILGQR
jgi:hypothetical protein